jgi:hypothetical protein
MNLLTQICFSALGPGDRSAGIHVGDNLQPREFVEPGIPAHEVWQLPAEYDWNMPSLSREPVENDHQDSVEGGLYWLWDMTWNGVGG